ncbi:MAG: ATP-dependent Clp protease adaptor ClpS [Lachnospiraceae bacterium]|nr:ATP-dependent Clp protease adaptor ClpS [Lachnospiraceae bacterium]
MGTKGSVKERSIVKINVPRQYAVVMHNDDFTPMDFVVNILMEVFHKEYDDAVNIMMVVHKGDRAVVGTYSYDIARSKAEKAMVLAREEGYPFRITVEES